MVGDPLAALNDALAGTRAAGSARVELASESSWDLPAFVQRRRGGLLRPVIDAGKAAARRPLEQTCEGVVDLDGRRYMLDYGSFARLYADGHEWSGRSGRAIATLSGADRSLLASPLWLLDVLTGATAALEEGTETVRGTPCRRLATMVDLGVASGRTPGGIVVPRMRFEDLLAFPVNAWIDDAHVRRVRVGLEHQTDTVTLCDFSVSLDLDWTRLPESAADDTAGRAHDTRS
jgi:hypothetical protein